MTAGRPHGWNDWYRFAREELGLAHDECVEYANVRFVEEQNRDALRGGGDTQRPRPRTRPGGARGGSSSRPRGSAPSSSSSDT